MMMMMNFPRMTLDVWRNTKLIEKCVNLLEKRFALRVLRTLSSLRKRATSGMLYQAVQLLLPESKPTDASVTVKAQILGYLSKVCS